MDKRSKSNFDQHLSAIPLNIYTSVGDVLLNQVAPSVEICLNSVLSEFENSQKRTSSLSEIAQEVRVLQTEVGALKRRVLALNTPADEDFLILIAEGKGNEVITTVGKGQERKGITFFFIFILIFILIFIYS